MSSNLGNQERYNRAIASVITDMQAAFGPDLIGLLLGGSVAYGSPLRRSDLDIYVTIRPAWRQRRTLMVEGVEVELFINPVHQIRKEFKSSSSTFTMFAQGRVLYDPQGLMAMLVQEARQVQAQPRPAVSSEDLPRLRYNLTDLLNDAQDLAEVDEVAATYLIFLSLEAALDTYYRLQRRWLPKPKYLLRDLREHSPEIEQVVSRILANHTSIAGRTASLTVLVERVLEPVGELIGAWETAPEAVPEVDGGSAVSP